MNERETEGQRIPVCTTAGAMVGDSRSALRIELATHEGSLEQGTKRRRVDRLVDAATAALERGHRAQALAAVAEIASCDPNNPQLAVLKAQVGDLPRPDRRRAGRWVGTAAIVVGGVWGSYVTYHAFEERASPKTPSSGAAAPAAHLARPAAVPGLSVVASIPFRLQDSVKTVDRRVVGEHSAEGSGRSRHAEHSVASKPTAASRGRTTNVVAAGSAAQETLRVTPARRVAASSPLPSESAPVSSALSSDVPALAASATTAVPAVPTTSTASDEGLVKGVLQRYREAYADLDARAARAVWPPVDETALARAFGGLRSQQITFNECNLEVHGEAASARCRGSMRYVPKIGGPDPRIEQRVWYFSLRKQGTDWTIESARAVR